MAPIFALEELEARDVPAVVVHFDYSRDTSGFFADPARRAVLEQSAQAITSQIQDTLAPIQPSGPNSWTASFTDPRTNETVQLPNLALGEGEIRVFVAGGTIGEEELGLTTSGGFSAKGMPDWLNAVRGRGHAGALAEPVTQYTTWGGMITFDDHANWNFGTGQPGASQYDFESVATHELMHVLGFGLGEPAFTRNVVNDQFVGPNVVAAAGGPVATQGEPADHFAQGTAWHGEGSPMQPSIMPGQRRLMTPLEYAALADIGWGVQAQTSSSRAPVVADFAAPPQAAPILATPVVASTALKGVGTWAAGTTSSAIAYGAAGEIEQIYQPVTPGGSVRVATADVNGDGVKDTFLGSGPGVSATVELVDGRSGQVLGTVAPFEAAFTGGVFLATGDLNGDGHADLVVTPDQSGGPAVAVYDGAALARGEVRQLDRFWGMNDPSFRGGLRPALGDLNGDGIPDLAISAGFGGGPRVTVLDGRGLADGAIPTKLVADFFAFDPNLRNGAFVALADLNGDGRAELIIGAGPGGGPRISVYSGRDLAAGPRIILADFFAGDPSGRLGVRVAATDVNGDGHADIVAGTASQALVYAASDVLAANFNPILGVPVPGASGSQGVFVG